MFGRRYFGGRYFGPRYFGEGSSGVPTTPAVTCDAATWLLLCQEEEAAGDLYEVLAVLAHADSDLISAFGRSAFLWHSLAPHSEEFPFAVITQASGDDEWDSPGSGSASRIARSEFTLTVYDEDRRDARSLARQLTGVIEAADLAGTLTHDECTTLYCRRSGKGSDAIDPERSPSGGDVWGHTIPFVVIDDEVDS